MKAAPEKIYVQPDAHDGWFETNNLNQSLIEYTRTDAFIDKACDWMDNHCKLLSSKDYEDFRDYMKGK